MELVRCQYHAKGARALVADGPLAYTYPPVGRMIPDAGDRHWLAQDVEEVGRVDVGLLVAVRAYDLARRILQMGLGGAQRGVRDRAAHFLFPDGGQGDGGLGLHGYFRFVFRAADGGALVLLTFSRPNLRN